MGDFTFKGSALKFKALDDVRASQLVVHGMGRCFPRFWIKQPLGVRLATQSDSYGIVAGVALHDARKGDMLDVAVQCLVSMPHRPVSRTRWQRFRDMFRRKSVSAAMSPCNEHVIVGTAVSPTVLYVQPGIVDVDTARKLAGRGGDE